MNDQRLARTGLALRLAAAFAGVALATALAVAIAAPPIVGRGFAAMQAAQGSAGAGPGRGQGMGPGAGLGPGGYAAQLQQETTLTIVLVAVVAASLASLVGVYLARRIAKPLVSLEATAAAVARGDLAARSGLAGRGDEIGSLGRSFDAMAADLERLEESRRRFFQDAAHEMKTPLAVIDATAAAVMDGVYIHDDRHLATIREQARVLGRVVDDLRTISLADTGALPLNVSDVQLGAVIASVASAFAARAEARRVTLSAAPATGADPVVRVDRDRFGQAVATMVDNGIRFASPGGNVEIRASSPTAGTVRVEVLDDGPGVPPEDLPRVFDRFYQADVSRDRSSGTSGLGLAIARAIAEAHGGRVGVENRAGGGATFWIEVPRAGTRRA